MLVDAAHTTIDVMRGNKKDTPDNRNGFVPNHVLDFMRNPGSQTHRQKTRNSQNQNPFIFMMIIALRKSVQTDRNNQHEYDDVKHRIVKVFG